MRIMVVITRIYVEKGGQNDEWISVFSLNKDLDEYICEKQDCKLIMIHGYRDRFPYNNKNAFINVFGSLQERNYLQGNVLVLVHPRVKEISLIENAINTICNNCKIEEISEYGSNNRMYPEYKKLLNKDKSLNLEAFEELWQFFFNKKRTLKQKVFDFLLFLTPLHASLQAFWGVAVKKLPEDWKAKPIEFIRIGMRDGNDILPKINVQRNQLDLLEVSESEIRGEYLELFPNPEAFLLVEEAEYDFYAPLINLVTDGERGLASGKTANSSEEEEFYNLPTLSEIIKEIQDRTREKEEFWKGLAEAFNHTNSQRPIPKIENGKWQYDPHQFISCLREICAILANTKNCSKEEKIYGYKGRLEVKRFLPQLNEKFVAHCKLKEHKEKCYFELISQLTSWGLDKSMVVIGGIEVLAKQLRIM